MKIQCCFALFFIITFLCLRKCECEDFDGLKERVEQLNGRVTQLVQCRSPIPSKLLLLIILLAIKPWQIDQMVPWPQSKDSFW